MIILFNFNNFNNFFNFGEFKNYLFLYDFNNLEIFCKRYHFK